MEFERLKQLYDQNEEAQAEMVEKAAQASQLLDVQETVVRSFQRLVDYLDQRVSKTQVVNQLKEIGTPDALRVVDAVNQLHSTLEGKNIDLNPIIDTLREELSKVSESVKNIPQVEIPKQIDNTKQLEGLTQAINAVKDAVQAQQTTVEAPIVNVDAPHVTVDAPDLKPLAKELEASFKKAVGLIDIPKVDFSDVVKHQKETTKAVKDLNKTLEEMPSGGGGGGSTSIAPFLDDNGALPVAPVVVDYDKQFSYTSTTDVIEYQLDSVTVKTKTVTYTDATKSVVDSIVWS